MAATIIITPNQVASLDISANGTSTVTIGMTNIGLQGPPGPNEIGGYGIAITDVSNGQLLAFKDGSWKNQSPTEITNGGSF